MIHTRQSVQAAYDRAMSMDEDHEAALLAVAHSLGLPVEAVRDVVEGVPA